MLPRYRPQVVRLGGLGANLNPQPQRPRNKPVPIAPKPPLPPAITINLSPDQSFQSDDGAISAENLLGSIDSADESEKEGDKMVTETDYSDFTSAEYISVEPIPDCLIEDEMTASTTTTILEPSSPPATTTTIIENSPTGQSNEDSNIKSIRYNKSSFVNLESIHCNSCSKIFLGLSIYHRHLDKCKQKRIGEDQGMTQQRAQATKKLSLAVGRGQVPCILIATPAPMAMVSAEVSKKKKRKRAFQTDAKKLFTARGTPIAMLPVVQAQPTVPAMKPMPMLMVSFTVYRPGQQEFQGGGGCKKSVYHCVSVLISNP